MAVTARLQSGSSFGARLLGTLALGALALPSSGLTAQDMAADSPPAGTGSPVRPHWQLRSPAAFGLDSAALAAAYGRAAGLPGLTSLLVARNGELVAEAYYRGMSAERPVNIKSVAKSVLSALVGIALEQGKLAGLDQPLAELLPDYLPRGADARRRAITLRHLLTMTAGLETTSFENYGRWVSSRNWARHALGRRFVCDPGECMEYSTGNSHLLSVALTRATGMTTREFARRNLLDPLGMPDRSWQRDPQGYYLGGNDMWFTPRELWRFGQLYLDGGRDGSRQVVPAEWIQASWGEYATSPWNGYGYGYHWWSRVMNGHRVHFALGYGGQLVFVAPALGMVVVATSTVDAARESINSRAVQSLVENILLPAVREAP